MQISHAYFVFLYYPRRLYRSAAWVGFSSPSVIVCLFVCPQHSLTQKRMIPKFSNLVGMFLGSWDIVYRSDTRFGGLKLKGQRSMSYDQ